MNMHFNLRVEGFVPEPTFWENKQQLGARLCRERCAVVESRSKFRILAARGANLEIGSDLRKALSLTASEQDAITNACRQETRALVTARGEPMLVCADWHNSLGLSLIVLPDCDEEAARYTLHSMNRTDVSCSAPDHKPSAEACRRAFATLSDILSYLDAILQPVFPPEGDPALLFRIAAFAGCRLDGETIYELSLRAFPITSPRSVAFLLCTVRQGARPTTVSAADAPLYTTAPCFYGCTLQADPSGALLVSLPLDFADTLASDPFGVGRKLVLCIEQILPAPDTKM